MAQNDDIQLFEDKRIRTAWDEEKEEWYFSVVDVVAVLTDQPDEHHPCFELFYRNTGGFLFGKPCIAGLSAFYK